MNNNYNWIDDTYKITFPVSKSLQEDFDEAEELDRKKDAAYFCVADYIDVGCKMLMQPGK